MTLTGAGLLWFGWFGFNAGSALALGQLAALAFVTTHLGAAGGALGWLARRVDAPRQADRARRRVGPRRGPRRASRRPPASSRPGRRSSSASPPARVCYGAVVLKDKLGYDDSLDAFGVHGVGGLLGALLTGVFAEKALNEAGATAFSRQTPRSSARRPSPCWRRGSTRGGHLRHPQAHRRHHRPARDRARRARGARPEPARRGGVRRRVGRLLARRRRSARRCTPSSNRSAS